MKRESEKENADIIETLCESDICNKGCERHFHRFLHFFHFGSLDVIQCEEVMPICVKYWQSFSNVLTHKFIFSIFLSQLT